MPKAGLPTSSFGSYQPIMGAPVALPGTAGRGSQNLQETQADLDIEGMLSQLEQLPAFKITPPAMAPAEAPETDPFIGINPATKQLYVNGFIFDENDAASALASRDYLQGREEPTDGGQWRRLPRSVYEQYLQSIEDPTLGRRFAKNFAVGTGSLQELWGAALMGISGGEVGQGLYEEGQATQERLAPFVKRLSGVKNADDAVDYFVGLVGSQSPQILESVVTALIGAGLGAGVGSVGGPVGTGAGAAGGFAAGIMAKGAVKGQLKDIAEKLIRGEALDAAEQAAWKEGAGKTGMAIRLAAKKKAAGEVLTPSEQKLLRQGAAITGAMTLSTLENYGIGYGDIRSEQMENGVDGAPGANATAALLAVPYAALSSLPEFVGAMTFMKSSTRAASRTAMQTAGTYAGRVGVGFGAGAVLEGGTEAAQEGLVMQGSEAFGAQYTAAEKGERFLEAGVAGGLIGGAIGAPVNLLRKREKPAAPTPPAPAAPAPTAPVAPPAEPIDMGGLADLEDTFPLTGAPGDGFLGEAPPYVAPDRAPSMGGIEQEQLPTVGAPQVFPPQGPAPISVPPEQPEVYRPNPAGVIGPQGTLFEGQVVGGVVPEQAPPVAQEPPLVEPGQLPLLTPQGQPTPQVVKGAVFGTGIKPGTKAAKALTQMVRVTGGQVTPEAAFNLGTAEGVKVQPYKIDELTRTAQGDIVALDFSVGNSKVTVAYDEGLYGSPENFASAMGVDFGLFDTGTFQRHTSAGAVSAPMPVTEYTPPLAPMAPAEKAKRVQTRAAAKAAPKAQPKAKPTKGLKGAIQKRSATKVDAGEQAGPSAADAAPAPERKAPRQSLRKTEQAAEPTVSEATEAAPVGETPRVEPTKSLKKPKAAKSEADAAIDEKMKEVDAKLAAAQERLRKAAEEQEAKKKLTEKVKARQAKTPKPEVERAKNLAAGETALKVLKEKPRRDAVVKMRDMDDVDLRQYYESNPSEQRAIDAIVMMAARMTEQDRKEFFSDDGNDKVFRAAIAAFNNPPDAITKEIIADPGKKSDPQKGGMFSVGDDEQLPPNVVRLTRGKFPEGKPTKNTLDTHPEVLAELKSLMEERIKRGYEIIEPSPEYYQSLTPTERERAQNEIDIYREQQFRVELARERAWKAMKDKLIAEKTLVFKVGDLVHLDARTARESLPWRITSYFISVNNTNKFGYYMWHPSAGEVVVLISDGADITVDNTQATWTRASKQETSDYYAAVARDSETGGGDSLFEMERAKAASFEAQKLRFNQMRVRLADEVGLNTGDKFLVPGIDVPVTVTKYVAHKYDGSYGIILTDGAGNTYTKYIFDGDPQTGTIRESFYNWKKFTGPRGQFALADVDAGIEGTPIGQVRLTVQRMLSRLAPAIRAQLDVRVFENQGTQLLRDPEDFNLSRNARQRFLNSQHGGAVEGVPDTFLPDLRDDADIRAVLPALYNEKEPDGSSIFLVNPTSEQLDALYEKHDYTIVKLLATKKGNLIAFSTYHFAIHYEAIGALNQGKPGIDLGRGYYYPKLFAGKTNIEYINSPVHRFVDDMGYDWKVDPNATTPAPPRSKGVNADIATLREELAKAEGDPELMRNINSLIEDLKFRSKQAVANDYEKTKAAGFIYYRGTKAQVRLFSDNVGDPAFVFGHEVVGHFGVTAVVGEENMPGMVSTMERDPYIRNSIEAMRERRPNASQSEIVEEIIADYAGALERKADNAPIMFALDRIVRFVRDAFARIGFKNLDDAQVYALVMASRKYVRTGRKPHFFLNSVFAAEASGYKFSQRNTGAFGTSGVRRNVLNEVLQDLGPEATWTDISLALSERGEPPVSAESLRRRVRGYISEYTDVDQTAPEWLTVSRSLGEGTSAASNQGAGSRSPDMATVIAAFEANPNATRQQIADETGFSKDKIGQILSQVRQRPPGGVVPAWARAKKQGRPAQFSVSPNPTGKRLDYNPDALLKALEANPTLSVSVVAKQLGLDLSPRQLRGVLTTMRRQFEADGKPVPPALERGLNVSRSEETAAIYDVAEQNPSATIDRLAEISGIDRERIVTTLKNRRTRMEARGEVAPQWLLPRRRKDTSGGMYSLADPISFGQAVGAMDRSRYTMAPALEKAGEFFRGSGINLRELMSRLAADLKTMNFSSRSNAGYREAYQILADTSNLISKLRTKYNQMLEEVLHESDQKVSLEVSKMLQFTAISKLQKATDKMVRELPKLITVVGDQVVVDERVFADLKAMGRYTLDEFKAGISYNYEDVVYNSSTGKTEKQTFTRKLEAMPGLTEQSPEWVQYTKVRDAMDEAAIDRVRADYLAIQGERRNTLRRISTIIDRPLSADDIGFINMLDNRYRELAKKNISEAEDGSSIYQEGSLEQAENMMAAFNRALIADRNDPQLQQPFAEFFPEAQRADVIAKLQAFRVGVKIAASVKYDVQRVIANMAAIELGKEDNELHAKRSIVGGYVPIGREGSWQVRARLRDANGRIVGVHQDFAHQLPYFQLPNRADAESLAARIKNMMSEAGGLEMELPVMDPETRQYVGKKVTVEFVAETARQTPVNGARVNMNDFIRLLNRFAVNITPQARERIVIGLTAQNARARQNLLRENVPGQDPNSLPYITRHLESLANISGRRENQHRIDMLMDQNDSFSQRLWNMDEEVLKKKENVLEATRSNPDSTQEQILAAQRDYDAYKFMLDRTQKLGGGNKFKDKFARDLAYLDAQKSIEYSDFESDGIAAEVKTFTAVAQLGGSFATAALNVLSLPFNVLPALSFYNSQNGFGGGFGYGKSAAELTKALGQVGGLGKYEAAYYEKLLGNPAALQAEGLTEQEAKFLADEISQGSLQAAMANALTATARGKASGNVRMQTAINAFMSAFTYTEQASRRAAALAAYRMEFERARAEGRDMDVAVRRATDFAVDITKQTLGEYSMFNRPAFFRGGLLEYVFMYKMYVVSTIQLLSALPTQGKIAMLAAIWLTSGLKGMPFAEDILDLLDTIMQQLGFPVGSAEGVIAGYVNDVVPGAGATVMRGVMDQMLPATISTRTGLGNIIPGTSIFIAGADPFREVMEVAGPAASAVEGTIATVGNMGRGAAALTGLGEREFDATQFLRENPVTLVRAIGDSITYMDTGAIVDSKGYVLSQDMHAGVVASRLLGFYPSAATKQNDVIKLAKRTADYQRATSTEFRLRYVRAALAGDDARVRSVISDVADWNRKAKGTGLEVPNFAMNANKALREAKKAGTERYEKSAPKAVKPLVEEYRETYGVE